MNFPKFGKLERKQIDMKMDKKTAMKELVLLLPELSQSGTRVAELIALFDSQLELVEQQGQKADELLALRDENMKKVEKTEQEVDKEIERHNTLLERAQALISDLDEEVLNMTAEELKKYVEDDMGGQLAPQDLVDAEEGEDDA